MSSWGASAEGWSDGPEELAPEAPEELLPELLPKLPPEAPPGESPPAEGLFPFGLGEPFCPDEAMTWTVPSGCFAKTNR